MKYTKSQIKPIILKAHHFAMMDRRKDKERPDYVYQQSFVDRLFGLVESELGLTILISQKEIQEFEDQLFEAASIKRSSSTYKTGGFLKDAMLKLTDFLNKKISSF